MNRGRVLSIQALESLHVTGLRALNDVVHLTSVVRRCDIDGSSRP
jgi:hypothetical protein